MNNYGFYGANERFCKKILVSISEGNTEVTTTKEEGHQFIQAARLLWQKWQQFLSTKNLDARITTANKIQTIIGQWGMEKDDLTQDILEAVRSNLSLEISALRTDALDKDEYVSTALDAVKAIVLKPSKTHHDNNDADSKDLIDFNTIQVGLQDVLQHIKDHKLKNSQTKHQNNLQVTQSNTHAMENVYRAKAAAVTLDVTALQQTSEKLFNKQEQKISGGNPHGFKVSTRKALRQLDPIKDYFEKKLKYIDVLYQAEDVKKQVLLELESYYRKNFTKSSDAAHYDLVGGPKIFEIDDLKRGLSRQVLASAFPQLTFIFRNQKLASRRGIITQSQAKMPPNRAPRKQSSQKKKSTKRSTTPPRRKRLRQKLDKFFFEEIDQFIDGIIQYQAYVNHKSEGYLQNESQIRHFFTVEQKVVQNYSYNYNRLGQLLEHGDKLIKLHKRKVQIKFDENEKAFNGVYGHLAKIALKSITKMSDHEDQKVICLAFIHHLESTGLWEKVKDTAVKIWSDFRLNQTPWLIQQYREDNALAGYVLEIMHGANLLTLLADHAGDSHDVFFKLQALTQRTNSDPVKTLAYYEKCSHDSTYLAYSKEKTTAQLFVDILLHKDGEIKGLFKAFKRWKRKSNTNPVKTIGELLLISSTLKHSIVHEKLTTMLIKQYDKLDPQEANAFVEALLRFYPDVFDCRDSVNLLNVMLDLIVFLRQKITDKSAKIYSLKDSIKAFENLCKVKIGKKIQQVGKARPAKVCTEINNNTAQIDEIEKQEKTPRASTCSWLVQGTKQFFNPWFEWTSWFQGPGDFMAVLFRFKVTQKQLEDTYDKAVDAMHYYEDAPDAVNYFIKFLNLVDLPVLDRIDDTFDLDNQINKVIALKWLAQIYFEDEGIPRDDIKADKYAMLAYNLYFDLRTQYSGDKDFQCESFQSEVNDLFELKTKIHFELALTYFNKGNARSVDYCQQFLTEEEMVDVQQANIIKTILARIFYDGTGGVKQSFAKAKSYLESMTSINYYHLMIKNGYLSLIYLQGHDGLEPNMFKAHHYHELLENCRSKSQLRMDLLNTFHYLKALCFLNLGEISYMIDSLKRMTCRKNQSMVIKKYGLLMLGYYHDCLGSKNPVKSNLAIKNCKAEAYELGINSQTLKSYMQGKKQLPLRAKLLDIKGIKSRKKR
ncbi:MAG TPA: hypothetical protein QF353_01485 [Gammaproteobacteria bacterium]|nr:hypothetical protein [Gammaproteobacteria bacterium]